MSKNSPALVSPASPAIVADFAKAKEYWQAARVAAGQSAAFMILMGAELERLHKQHGVKAGRPAAGNSFSVKELSWPQLVEQHVGCSESQAWRAREMFKASRKRVPLLDGAELLTTPIAKLPEKRQEELLKAVAKVTDGKSAAEVMRDFGIAKKEQGGAAKGGNTRKPAKDAGATPADEADAPPAAPAQSKIPAGWEERAYRLNTLLEEALHDGWWNDCTEEHRKTLHGNLVDATNALAATLKKGSKS